MVTTRSVSTRGGGTLNVVNEALRLLSWLAARL
jgi:hypothetical protein